MQWISRYSGPCIQDPLLVSFISHEMKDAIKGNLGCHSFICCKFNFKSDKDQNLLKKIYLKNLNIISPKSYSFVHVLLLLTDSPRYVIFTISWRLCTSLMQFLHPLGLVCRQTQSALNAQKRSVKPKIYISFDVNAFFVIIHSTMTLKSCICNGYKRHYDKFDNSQILLVLVWLLPSFDQHLDITFWVRFSRE